MKRFFYVQKEGKLKLFNRRSRDKLTENRNDDKLNDFIKGVDVDIGGGGGVNSGVAVDELRSMQTSAVYACVRVISETIASLPCYLYKKEKDKQVPAREHPLFEVLHDMPNSEMTSYTFREVIMTSLLLYGNAYARIIKDKAGHCTGLWYLKPQYMQVERDTHTKKIKYTYSDDITNKTFVYKPEQIFHIVGLSYDGIKGISPIDQAKVAVGLALARGEFGAWFFGYVLKGSFLNNYKL